MVRLKLKGDDLHLDRPLDEDPMRRQRIEDELEIVMEDRGLTKGEGPSGGDYHASFEGAALHVNMKRKMSDVDMQEMAADLFSRIPSLLSEKAEAVP